MKKKKERKEKEEMNDPKEEALVKEKRVLDYLRKLACVKPYRMDRKGENPR